MQKQYCDYSKILQQFTLVIKVRSILDYFAKMKSFSTYYSDFIFHSILELIQKLKPIEVMNYSQHLYFIEKNL